MIRSDSALSARPPNIIVPRHSSLTWTPVRPNGRYFTRSPPVARLNVGATSRMQRTEQSLELRSGHEIRRPETRFGDQNAKKGAWACNTPGGPIGSVAGRCPAYGHERLRRERGVEEVGDDGRDEIGAFHRQGVGGPRDDRQLAGRERLVQGACVRQQDEVVV